MERKRQREKRTPVTVKGATKVQPLVTLQSNARANPTKTLLTKIDLWHFGGCFRRWKGELKKRMESVSEANISTTSVSSTVAKPVSETERCRHRPRCPLKPSAANVTAACFERVLLHC